MRRWCQPVARSARAWARRAGGAAALWALLVGGLRVSAAPPNIILVMTDDQGYGPIGRHGNSWIRTPNLDALHDRSTRFTRFLVSPTCSPTRSALMTGRHPMKNGITHTILERERMTLEAVTLPQVLKGAGYRTGIFGKWHLGDEEAYQPHHRGFDEAFIHGAGGIGQAYDCSCADAPQNSYFDPVIRHNGRFVKTRGFCTDVFFTAAIGWIGQQREAGRPFFAYISSNAPHSPYHAPEEKLRRFRELGFGAAQAGFYGMIENIDENVGRLMGKLEAWGMLRNTVVIFMSDNGSAGDGLGRGILGKGPGGEPLAAWNDGMKGFKNSADEGGVRVPFFLRWDGRFKAGRDIDRIAAHIDLLPTLAEIAGAKLPAHQVEGRSLAPLLKDAKAAASWGDRYLFTHIGRWPVGANPDDHRWKGAAVRTQRWRLVGTDTLYDMETDPGQERNVIAAHPDVAARMRKAFERFWWETRPMLVNEGAPMSPTRPFWVSYEAQKAAEGIPEWTPPVF